MVGWPVVDRIARGECGVGREREKEGRLLIQ